MAMKNQLQSGNKQDLGTNDIFISRTLFNAQANGYDVPRFHVVITSIILSACAVHPTYTYDTACYTVLAALIKFKWS